jgi:hypothetical protein
MLLHQTCALLAFLSDQSDLSTWLTGRKYWTINIWIGFLCLDYPLRILWDIRGIFVLSDASRSFQQKPLAPCWTYIQIFTVQYLINLLEGIRFPCRRLGNQPTVCPFFIRTHVYFVRDLPYFRIFFHTPRFFFVQSSASSFGFLLIIINFFFFYNILVSAIAYILQYTGSCNYIHIIINILVSAITYTL